jgi:hypothetical protein
VTDYPAWLTGIVTKRTPEILRMLMELCEAGLRKGEVSGNDLTERNLTQPNSIGATFKLLGKVGFVTTNRITRSTNQKSHGAIILIHELRERWKAEAFIDKCREHLLGLKVDGNGQTRLAL